MRWLAARETFSVVQIGAYIGETPNDPLFGYLRATIPDHPNRVAVLVEPVREYFDALRVAYRTYPQSALRMLRSPKRRESVTCTGWNPRWIRPTTNIRSGSGR